MSRTQVVLASVTTDLDQQSCSPLSQILVSCNRHSNPKAFLAVASRELGPMIHPVKEELDVNLRLPGAAYGTMTKQVHSH